LKLLESLIKNKFANNWISVRKAFLDLDLDHDGFITAQDIMRFCGDSNKDIDFNDLVILIYKRDSNKSGKLSYLDFSKWMGVVIH
jgi:Ca2+-binding EF-hand superfamily protein